MASKRDLKKEVNNMVFDVVEECFSLQLYDESKREVTDKFIEEAADYMEEILSKINTAKTKKDFAPLRAEIEKTGEAWVERLNKLQ
jgi:hypothetical protein